MGQEFVTPKVLPPHYFVLSVLLIAAIGWWDAHRLLAGYWPFLGVLPMLVGLAVAVKGSRQFAEAETNIIPLSRSSTLVTNGVFSFSRNPMYLGMLLFLGGASLVANSAWAWLVPAAFFVLIRQAFVLREEPLMAATFGADYEAYRSRVRRWI